MSSEDSSGKTLTQGLLCNPGVYVWLEESSQLSSAWPDYDLTMCLIARDNRPSSAMNEQNSEEASSGSVLTQGSLWNLELMLPRRELDASFRLIGTYFLNFCSSDPHHGQTGNFVCSRYGYKDYVLTVRVFLEMHLQVASAAAIARATEAEGI
ncbi:hypothetical protein R1flu_024522 [Riccia fluitans]|uniref:Uncharacterized protein n=1 Tax=Riccia fluitans TaxID=41844 RepID=A0ABD1XV45_9MARC